MLRGVAECISSNLRKTDILARFGGEEFCIACVKMYPQSIKNVFERIRKNVEDLVVKTSGYEIQVTVSIGVCTNIKNSLEEMITCSDDLLYRAKDLGRNQVVLET